MSEKPEDSERVVLPEGSLAGDLTNAFDVYIRMNDDPERDYCFSVNKNGRLTIE